MSASAVTATMRALSRRRFLALLGVTLAGARASFSADLSPRSGPLGGFGDGDRFGVAATDGDGVTAAQRFEGRVHAVVARPRRPHAVVVARRPGRFAVCCHLDGLRPLTAFAAAPERHFYGHGAFDSSGARLFTSENDYQNERGVIGVRDAEHGYRQIDEWDSGGIGPHQIALAANGRSLVVANGGILTHPDSGRAKLNVPEMRPTLTRLDPRDGGRLAECALADDLRYLSIRHIAPAANDDVVFAMQNEGPPDPRLPLVGVWRRSDRVELFAPPAEFRVGYVGSVAIDPAEQIIAATAPRDDRVAFYSLRGGALLATLALTDGCGAAAGDAAGEFWLSSGAGELLKVRVDASGAAVLRRWRWTAQWDNHLTRI